MGQNNVFQLPHGDKPKDNPKGSAFELALQQALGVICAVALAFVVGMGLRVILFLLCPCGRGWTP